VPGGRSAAVSVQAGLDGGEHMFVSLEGVDGSQLPGLAQRRVAGLVTRCSSTWPTAFSRCLATGLQPPLHRWGDGWVIGTQYR
jgi:hypothetical protein